MGRSTGIAKAAAQGAFYLLILALLAGRSVSAPISHDENQFIAPGQFLLQGLLPYRDYPQLHTPYSVPFYALSALVSDYDFLAGRLLSTLAWLACVVLMAAIVRRLRQVPLDDSRRGPAWSTLLWEFLLIYLFVNHATAVFVLRAALNHSLASLFALLAAWFLVRGMGKPEAAGRNALYCGASAAAAGLVRFNFASITLVLLACWAILGFWLRRTHPGRTLLSFAAGCLAGAAPAIALAALAPSAFYYGNLVYIRLNTIYFEQLLHRTGMTLQSKAALFAGGVLRLPLEVLLYGVLIVSAAAAVRRIARRGDPIEVARLGLAGMATSLWMSAFAPTPGLLHYFAAPGPFLFVLLGGFELPAGRFRRWGMGAVAFVVAAAALMSDGPRSPVRLLTALADPTQWTPVKMHALARELNAHVDGGRLLTLQSMLAMEAGYEAYPFTASGPFSWRTSLLLTPERRATYGVTSPEELEVVLEAQPPDGILVGFESPNPGFTRGEQGGLERPFSDYAREHGYAAIRLRPQLWPRGLTLWVRQGDD